MIPIDESHWHSLDEEWIRLPEGHHAQYARDDDALVVRISGRNAHVLGSGPHLQEAVDAALKFLESVGGEL